MGLIVNQKELGRILGKSSATLTKWQEAGMPFIPAAKKMKQGVGNQYNTEQVIAWLVARESNAGSANYEQEKTRLTQAQADKAELDLARLRGELIPAEEAEEAWGEMVSNFRAKILALPVKLAFQVAGLQDVKAVRALLETETCEALTELANGKYGKNMGRDPKRGKTRRAAPKADDR